MPNFLYRAVSEQGQIVRSQIEEVSRSALIRKLKRNGLTPIHIQQKNKMILSTGSKKKQKKNITNISEVVKDADIYLDLDKNRKEKSFFTKLNDELVSSTSKITSRDLVVFTQDLYLLKKANFNNIHALSTIIEKTENARFKEILRDILAGVESGESMYSTMEYYDDVFPYLYVNMVRVGEESGSLTKSLEEAVDYLDEANNLTKKLKSILIPNIAMLIAIIVILFAGTFFIVPLIQDVFESMGSTEQLPAITLWFQSFLTKLIEVWYIPVAIIAGIVIAILAYIKTPKGRYNFDYFKYRMPLFGKLIFAVDFDRLLKAMLLNLKNGVRIQEALEVSKNVCKNYVLRALVETSINNMIVGESWIEPFEKSNFASPMMIEMLNIGMQTDLQEMLEKLIEYMEIDIDNIIGKIMKALPEIVYGIVGIFLIFLVVVVLVPCIQAYMGGWIFSAAGV